MRKQSILLFLGVALAAYVTAHVRLIYSGNGNVLFWATPSNVSVVINANGSDDITDDSHFTALRSAFLAWNDVDKTTGTLIEDKSASEQASTDWQSDARHLILFDETNSSGYFPGASGIVAVTPLTFYTSGQIIDADILFNGKNFLFTTEGTPGRFDVQDVAVHELGHLLGLDHSACAGASMYPYVDPTIILHRSLSLDDIHGLQHMYPSGTFGLIWGTLTRASDGTPVKGAWVAVRDADGRTVGAALSKDNGEFYIQSLDPGTYTVYATPLGDPVGAGNLTAGHTIETDFEAEVLGTPVVGAGDTVNMGLLTVGADVPLELGRVADDYPLRTIAGQANALTVRGSGLVPGSTLVASDPDVVLSGFTWTGTSVSFTATPTAGEPNGHVDLTVTSGGETHILCAGLEITPPDPTVTSVVPGSGDSDGGTSVTINGSNFNPGASVVIGDRVYVDGLVGGCTVVSPTEITLTTKETVPGTHDVVVIDSSGVEGRDPDAYQMLAIPSISVVFPDAGDAAGGTTVVLTGSDFVAGSTVEINGIVQPNTTVDGPTKMTVVTEPGLPGFPYVLEVIAPGGQRASSVYTYSPKPDPLLTSVSPGSGSNAGGDVITLTGDNFTGETDVVFGAHSQTGGGGVPAASVQLVSPTTLQVTTPASASTSQTVMVCEADTGQASLIAGAFLFEGNSSGGGSGGGCAAIGPAGPPTWRGVVSGAGWILVLALLLALRARRAHVALVRYAPWPARTD